jgi:hypothetical protein
MSSDNPLDPLRQAREEEYFRHKNQGLITQMRDRMKMERLSDDLQAIGVADDALAQSLAGIGIDRATLPVLHLAPLLQVAWADGEIQDEERTLLIQAARSQGIEEGTPPDLVFLDLLKSRPTQQFYDAALTYVRAALAAMDSPAAATEARADLTSLAKQVALAHGKLFGMFGSGVSDPERDALDEIAGKLTAAHPLAASSVVGAIGPQDDD